MITLEQYLMGRDKEFPLDMLQARNAAILLSRVNYVLGKLDLKVAVSSGYRPAALNKTIGGAKMSTHTLCAGVDLHDPYKHLADKFRDHIELLAEVGLWMEHPDYSPGWIHLDIKQRKNRIFIP